MKTNRIKTRTKTIFSIRKANDEVMSKLTSHIDDLRKSNSYINHTVSPLGATKIMVELTFKVRVK